MNQAGYRVGVRRWDGRRVDRAGAPGETRPPITSLTSSAPALATNPTRPLANLDMGGSSRVQQGEDKRRKR